MAEGGNVGGIERLIISCADYPPNSRGDNPGPLLALIHPSAGKMNSPKFAVSSYPHVPRSWRNRTGPMPLFAPVQGDIVA
jgi:hypothetical protein